MKFNSSFLVHVRFSELRNSVVSKLSILCLPSIKKLHFDRFCPIYGTVLLLDNKRINNHVQLSV